MNRITPGIILIGLFILPALTGCVKKAEVVIDDTEFLPFDNLGVGPTATLTDTTEILLYSPDEWDAYRSRLHSVGAFKPVDFTQEMVALIAVPEESGGYSVEVESVEQKDSVIVVSYVLLSPERDCVTPMGRAVPYQAVSVRRADGPVRFERRTATFPCTVDNRL